MTPERLIRGAWDAKTRSGGSGPARAMRRLRRNLGDDADDPTCIFNKRRFGYRMPKGEEQEVEAT